jgi:hypothetical protein
MKPGTLKTIALTPVAVVSRSPCRYRGNQDGRIRCGGDETPPGHDGVGAFNDDLASPSSIDTPKAIDLSWT